MNTSRHASLKNWMAAAFSIFLVAAVSATPITAANVYWVEQLVVNTTLKTSVDGNTVSTIPESDMSIPHSLVATGDAIYWLDINGQSSTQAMVKKSALDGSNPSTLYTYSNSGAVVGFAGLSICGNTMFWSDPIMQVIYRAGLDGSSPTKIVTSGLTLPRTTAADAQYVYWANYDSGTIERALHDGSGRTLVASSAVFGESLLGIDKIALSNDGYIYWVRGGFGQLYRSRLDSFHPELLVSLSKDPIETTPDIALSDSNIYWVNVELGRIESFNLDGSGRKTFYQYNGTNLRDGPANVTVASVPEPKTIVLFALSFGIGLVSRKKRHRFALGRGDVWGRLPRVGRRADQPWAEVRNRVAVEARGALVDR